MNLLQAVGCMGIVALATVQAYAKETSQPEVPFPRHPIPEDDTEVTVPLPKHPVPPPAVKTYVDFTVMRDDLLNLIGKGKQKVWLATDYLTDGNVVTALYLAKYKEVDVKVLLDGAKANQYMSRLPFLQKHNTPVFIKPPNSLPSAPTLLIIDKETYRLDTELNFMTKQTQFSLIQQSPKKSKELIAAFTEALESPIKAIAKPIPAVGRPSPQNRWTNRNTSTPYQGEKDGSYNYNRAGSGGGAGEISRKLPGMTIYQIKERQKGNK
ncbi:MAG: hypothetical protein AB7T49_04305 [Oligoflexales bacterium]